MPLPPTREDDKRLLTHGVAVLTVTIVVLAFTRNASCARAATIGKLQGKGVDAVNGAGKSNDVVDPVTYTF